MRVALLSVIVLLACFSVLQVYSTSSGFIILPLGTSGGVNEGSMSGYALAVKPADGSNPNEWVLFESGSFVNGLRIASSYGVLSTLGVPNYTMQCQNSSTAPCSDWGYFMNVMIKGYFVSHPHLDHFSGLVIASASDSTGPLKNNQKKIYGMKFTTDSISSHIFNWITWPNMESTNSTPIAINLGTYASYTMYEGMEVPSVTSTMHATSYPLSHSTIGSAAYGTFNSTAFFFRSGGVTPDTSDRILIGFGDTGPDSVEGSTRLNNVWKAAAPYWISGQLVGILLECSYDNSRSNSLLFGHLSPNQVNAELTNFAAAVNAASTTPIGIRGLNVIVTHVKTSLFTDNPEALILSQLNANNTNNVNFIMPKQAATITLNPDRSTSVATLPSKCTTSNTNAAHRSVSSSSSMLFCFVTLISALFIGLRL